MSVYSKADSTHLPIWSCFNIGYIRYKAKCGHGEDTHSAQKGMRYCCECIPPGINWIIA